MSTISTTVLADNAYGTIAIALATTDTSLTFTTGHGARFPAVASPNVLYCCLLNSSNVLEEIQITAHIAGADTATIVRAAGGTSAKTWAVGDRIEARISNAVLDGITSFLPSGTGAVATPVAAYLNLKVKGLKSNYGAKGDGVTDDLAALNNALTYTGKIIEIEDATFFFSANPSVPTCAGIVGYGENVSVLKPGAAVTKVLSLSGSTNFLRDFKLDGTLTTGATGIVFGDTASGAYKASGLRAKNFTGAGAIGFKIYQALKSQFDKMTTDTCTNGYVYDGTGGAAGFPTTCTFLNCVATACSTYGWKFIQGYGALLVGCVAESSGSEGMIFIPGANATLTDITLLRCWLEANNSGAGFQITADGSAAGVTLRPSILDCYFNLSAALKAIRMTGAGCGGFLIDNPQLSLGTAGAIQFDASAYGKVANWPGNRAYNTIVTDTAFSATTPTLGAAGGPGSWTAYTPVYASDVGNQAATFNGAVTTTVARFKIIDKTLYLQLLWSGTLNAVTPVWISVSLPTGLNTQGNSTYPPCQIKNAATYEIGTCRYDGGNNLQFARAGNVAYTSAAAIHGNFTGEVEIQ